MQVECCNSLISFKMIDEAHISPINIPKQIGKYEDKKEKKKKEKRIEIGHKSIRFFSSLSFHFHK